ncbi:hypothetical protein ACXR2U_16775 [Jatrophihabitans sp. YIM 134969]
MDYRPRPAPCSHCGDTVLIATRQPTKVLGIKFGKPAPDRLEHADPSPDGELFDGVDDACHRAPVR